MSSKSSDKGLLSVAQGNGVSIRCHRSVKLPAFQTRGCLRDILAACTQVLLGQDVTVGGKRSFDFMIRPLFVLHLLYTVSFTDPVLRHCGCSFSRAGASALVWGIQVLQSRPAGRQEADRVFADRSGTH